MFPLYTILRYIHNAGHKYVSMVVEDGIWHMNQSRNHCRYSTVQEWLQSLPDSPDLSLIVVDKTFADREEKREQERAERAKEAATKKSKKWNVPVKFNHPRSLTWARHIYTMIRECSKKCNNRLLENEEARLAYNHLVHVLTDLTNFIVTSVPFARERYIRGIDIYDLQTMVHVYPTIILEEADLLAEVRIAYEPLYEHLKYTVVPYMNQVRLKMQKEADIKIYSDCRDRAVKKMMKLTEKYEKESEVLRDRMDRYQSYLDQLEAGEKIES
jgi:hypothetical protein